MEAPTKQPIEDSYHPNGVSQKSNLSQNIKEDFSEIISYFNEYLPNYISTPFRGSCLRMTKDLKNFVFASREGRIAKCDIDKKQLTLDVNLEEGSIWCIDISNDDTYLYSGGQGGNIKKFNLSTFDQEEVLKGHENEVNHVYLSKDNTALYSCSDDKTVRVWDLKTKKGKVIYEHNGLVYAMDLSEDNYHIASGAEDGTVIVYNLFEDKQVFTFEVQDAKVWCVKISSKNSFLASGDDKAQIHL